MDFEPVHRRISGVARKNPDKIAVHYGEKTVTYSQLEQRANQIANFFYKRRDGMSQYNPYVIVILDRSPELIESILGLFKSGFIFVPFDPQFPRQRLNLLIRETQAQWIITSQAFSKKFIGFIAENQRALDILVVDGSEDGTGTHDKTGFFSPASEAAEFPIRDNDAKNCYVYFTSGSTGVPKGVLGRHIGLSHFIEWELKEFEVNENVRASQLTKPTFDPFLRDIIVPLAAGGTCYIPGNDILMNPRKLVQWLDSRKITFVHIVPTLFREIQAVIADPGSLSTLEYILFAGELLRGNDIRKFVELFADRIRLINLYGPTETTLAKLFYRIKREDADKHIIPVGKPIPGAQVLILNQNMKKCLVGNVGEIYLRTPFISAGYFNDNELTKQVFIQNPFSDNPRDIIYKTGDLGRLLIDGNVELVGRVDHQVKIRGHRVEMGEIENCLLKYEGIKATVVMARTKTASSSAGEESNTYLCAYIVPPEAPAGGDTELNAGHLREFLSRWLPDYMIPSYFVTLEKMPLNPNGKIDRKSLPEPDSVNTLKSAVYAPPGNDWEKKIADIWMEVLEREMIGIYDNIHDLGGNSIKLIQISRRLNEVFQKDIPIMKLVEYTTVSELADYLRNDDRGDEFYGESKREGPGINAQTRQKLQQRRQRLKR